MMGLQFCSQLDFHHSIEEQHIFPVLAKKMPEFRKELDLLKQHKQIHAGLEKLEAYLEKCRSGEEDLRREEVRSLMDAFGKVLWQHLDEEVQTLRAENMRQYWSVDEMRKLPMWFNGTTIVEFIPYPLMNLYLRILFPLFDYYC